MCDERRSAKKKKKNTKKTKKEKRVAEVPEQFLSTGPWGGGKTGRGEVRAGNGFHDHPRGGKKKVKKKEGKRGPSYLPSPAGERSREEDGTASR